MILLLFLTTHQKLELLRELYQEYLVFKYILAYTDIHTSGDLADVLIAMNPASLKANMRWISKDAIIIVDTDSFIDKNFAKAGYTTDPLADETLTGHLVVKAPLTALTREAVKELNLDNKTAQKI